MNNPIFLLLCFSCSWYWFTPKQLVGLLPVKPEFFLPSLMKFLLRWRCVIVRVFYLKYKVCWVTIVVNWRSIKKMWIFIYKCKDKKKCLMLFLYIYFRFKKICFHGKHFKVYLIVNLLKTHMHFMQLFFKKYNFQCGGFSIVWLY